MQHSKDRPVDRAKILRCADKRLSATVKEAIKELGLTCRADEVIAELKAMLHKPALTNGESPHGRLYDNERAKVHNKEVANPDLGLLKEFESAIIEFGMNIDGIKGRKVSRLAANAIRLDPASDRRTKAGSTRPFMGRPELYDAEVVHFLAAAIAHALGLKRFTTGRHGDNTLTGEGGNGDPKMRILVDLLRYAMLIAWHTTAPTGTPIPKVKYESLLTVIRRVARQRDN